jgi:hypothetical protein
MEEESKKYLYNPTVGKLVTFIIGVTIIWIHKAIKKISFLKLKIMTIGIRPRKSAFGYFATVIF